MSDAGSNAGLDETATAKKAQLAEDLARAKAAGWNDPVPFNYAAPPGGAGHDESRDTAVWLSDAAVYAWDDEFGDVGEANPELEKMLYTGEHLQRAGGAIKALSFDVTVEGPEKVKPVRDVNYLPHSMSLMLTQYSSTMPACTPSCWRTSSCASTMSLPPSSHTASRPSSLDMTLSLSPRLVSHRYPTS